MGWRPHGDGQPLLPGCGCLFTCVALQGVEHPVGRPRLRKRSIRTSIGTLSACGRKIGCSRTHERPVNWFYRFSVEQGFELQPERVEFTEVIIYHPAQPTTPVVVAPTTPVAVEDFSVGQPPATHAARQASVAIPAENVAVEAEAILQRKANQRRASLRILGNTVHPAKGSALIVRKSEHPFSLPGKEKPRRSGRYISPAALGGARLVQ
jgi:hypothetical protein